MSDIAVDAVLLGLVEDLVAAAGVEPVLERQLAPPHVAGDELLDRRGPVADRIFGAGDDQDGQVERDPRFVVGELEVVEARQYRVRHAVREWLAAQRIALELPDLLGVAGLPFGTQGLATFATNGAFNATSRPPKTWLGCSAWAPVATVCSCPMTLSYWATSIPGMAPIVPHRIAPASRSPWFWMWDWVSAEPMLWPNAMSERFGYSVWRCRRVV